jgi:DNA-binding NarL/FixJ family response regulator
MSGPIDEAGPRSTEIAVLVVEDDQIVCAWLRGALRGTEFRIAAEAQTAGEAVELIGRRRVDLLLIDFKLPDVRGTELLRTLRAGGVGAPALLMTAAPTEGLNELARESGAQACVLKSAERDTLLAALRDAVGGAGRFASEHPIRPRGQAALSAREREALSLAAEGRTNKDIAAAMGVADETVKTLLERAYRKLGADGRLAAIRRAEELGLLSPRPEG